MEEERRWEDFPSDLLVHIFSKLKLDDLSLSLPFVCKSWYEASLLPESWKYLHFRELDFTWGTDFPIRFMREFHVKSFSFSTFMKLCFARSRGSVVELAIPFILGGSLQHDLISASIECPRLKALSLPRLQIKEENQLLTMIRRWKDLETLEITWKPNCFIEMLEEIRLNCPKFLGLHLCGYFNNTEARAIVSCMPKLRILKISASFLQKENLIMILDGCKELELFDASKCKGFDIDDEILKKATRIKKFKCEGCKFEDIYDLSFQWSCML